MLKVQSMYWNFGTIFPWAYRDSWLVCNMWVTATSHATFWPKIWQCGKWSIHIPICVVCNFKCYHQMGLVVHNFPKSRSHPTIVVTRRVMWSRFHTEHPQMVGATLFTWVTWFLRFVCLWMEVCVQECTYFPLANVITVVVSFWNGSL